MFDFYSNREIREMSVSEWEIYTDVFFLKDFPKKCSTGLSTTSDTQCGVANISTSFLGRITSPEK